MTHVSPASVLAALVALLGVASVWFLFEFVIALITRD